MKKILFLLLIITAFACQKDIVPLKSRSAVVALTDVNVGTTANDGTGQTIRSAFQTVNANNALIEAAIATTSTTTEVKNIVNDSLDALKTVALPLSDYAFMKADSNTYGNPISRTYFETYGGSSGGSGGYEWTQFIVGTTTGAPANTDTSFTIAALAGDRIELYRGTTADLSMQHLNKTATNGVTGYRYNSSGTLVVRPAWATGDRAYIRAVPGGYTTEVTLTDGESALSGKLLAGWELNETSGTLAADVLSTYNGTYVGSPLLNQSGKFGVAPDFDGIDDYVNAGTNAALRIQTFTISCWVNTTASGAYKGIVANHVARSAVQYGWAVLMSATGKVEFTVYYTGGQNQSVSTTSVNTGSWVNVICTFDGTNSNVYINNSASEDTDATAGTIIFHADNTFRIGDKSDVDYPFDGKIDAVYYFDEVITAGERTTLQTLTYPF